MSKNLDGIVAKIRDVRAQKRPEIEKNLQKIDALLAAIRDTRGRASAVAARYPDLATALQGISFNDAENKLNEARKSCEDALTRLRRDSINIGVAGKARQGKSQILQMLTGLGDAQIPTGDGDFCTASRSVVRNGDAQSATVFFLSESDLLSKKVFPSFAPIGTKYGVGLDSRKPGNLIAFMNDTYPTQKEIQKSGATSTAQQNWEKVLALQSDLKDASLRSRLGASPESVNMDSIRDYLVKDEGQKAYQVVDHVEIVTPFPGNLPKGMTVYDIPGLEDPTPGIKAAMLESIKNDADIVFFLRLPAASGDGWGEPDDDAFDMLRSVYPTGEVDINDWVQVILNHWPDRGNSKNAEKMKAGAMDKWGIKAVLCDCGKQDEVREMVDANIDALVSQAGRIDDLRIRQADEAFRIALAKANAIYDALRNASGDFVAQESGFDFERHLLTFMAELRGPLKKDMSPAFREMVREVLARHFKKAETRLEHLYAENADAKDFPPELPVFSKVRIKEEFDAGYGPAGVIEKTVRNQREAVLKLLRDQLTECCGELVARYYDCIVETGFNPNPSLNRISSVSDGDGSSKERLDRFLSAIRANGSYDSLESAIEGLLRFRLSFDETVLPAIYGIRDLDDFNPELPREVKDEGSHELDDIKAYIGGLHDSEKQTEAFFNWLRQKSESVLSCVTSGSDSSPLAIVSEHVANTMRANFDAFVFRFIWGNATGNEWRRFADHNKAVFWKEEFDKAAANSKLAQEWQAALSSLAAAL